MPSTRVGPQLEHRLLAGLSLLALMGAAWMAYSLPWPADAGHAQFPLVTAWQRLTAPGNATSILYLLPGLVVLDVLLAAGLALALSFSDARLPGVRCLRRALTFGSLSALHLFHLRLNPGFDGFPLVFADMLAFALGGLAVVDLLMFFAEYPRRLTGRDVRADLRQRATPTVLSKQRLRLTRLLEALLKRIDGLDVVERWARHDEVFWRITLHPAFRWGTPVVAAATGLLLMLENSNRARTVLELVVLAGAFLLPIQAFGAMGVKYRLGTADDRRHIEWIYLGPVVGFIIAMFLFWIPLLLFPMFGTETFDNSRLLGVPLIDWPNIGISSFMPILIASFLLGLAFSVFYTGAIDPRLAIRRSLMVGLSAIALTVVFVALENLLSTELASRLGLSSQAGLLISGAAAAMAFAPLRAKLEKMVERWLDRFIPKIEPEDGAFDASPNQ